MIQPKQVQRQVLKIVLAGEVPERVDSLVMEDGTVLYLEKIRKLVVPSKKNNKVPLVNKKTGKAYLKLSEQYHNWQKDNKEFFADEHRRFIAAGVRMPVVRCKLTIKFYFPDNRRRDLTNKEDTIIDELVHAGILGDDEAKVVGKKETSGVMKKDRPRTEIYITIINPGDPDYEYDQTDYEKYNKKVLENRAMRKRFQRGKKAMELSAETAAGTPANV